MMERRGLTEVVDYIIRFLLPGNESLSTRVGYTDNEEEFSKYDVVIVPSHFFLHYGQPESEPILPLQLIEGVPLLFGTPREEKKGSTKVVYADIIASTFFLISRYEEYMHPDDNRDIHGRYMGKSSLPGRAAFIDRPVVDEYANLLLGWLHEIRGDVKPIEPGFSRIVLTHDVDAIDHYRHLRGFLGGVKRNMFNSSGLKKVFCSLCDLRMDPAYTFEWLIEQDRRVKGAESLFFIKSPVKTHGLDYPIYNLQGNDFSTLLKLIKDGSCGIGLHTSYYSGSDPSVIAQELSELSKIIGEPVTSNRWHFLRTLAPSDFRKLVESGVTDDYTMGYADVAGFRLGTCRPVKWIDPERLKVTDLVLHPLLVMDCTLSNANYMGLTENEAREVVFSLLNKVRQCHGEVVLLWHNTSVSSLAGGYHSHLYLTIMDYLSNE